MILDPIGNCVPGSTSVKAEVQPQDFSYSFVCVHQVEYNKRLSSWNQNAYYTTIDLVDSSYTMVNGDSPTIIGYTVPSTWDWLLRFGRCSSTNNPTVTNDVYAYNVSYYQAIAGGYIAGLSKRSSIQPVILAPFSKATKIGCAYPDGGNTPGAVLLGYGSYYDFSSSAVTSPTNRTRTSWGFYYSTTPAATGWSIYYNVAPRAYVASTYMWESDIWAFNFMQYTDYVPFNYNYTGGPIYGTTCVAPGKNTYGTLALDRVILTDNMMGTIQAPATSTYQAGMILPR